MSNGIKIPVVPAPIDGIDIYTDPYRRIDYFHRSVPSRDIPIDTYDKIDYPRGTTHSSYAITWRTGHATYTYTTWTSVPLGMAKSERARLVVDDGTDRIVVLAVRWHVLGSSLTKSWEDLPASMANEVVLACRWVDRAIKEEKERRRAKQTQMRAAEEAYDRAVIERLAEASIARR